MSLPRFGMFYTIISLYKNSTLLSLFPFWDSNDTYIISFDAIPLVSAFLFILFILCSSDCIITIDLLSLFKYTFKVGPCSGVTIYQVHRHFCKVILILVRTVPIKWIDNQ